MGILKKNVTHMNTKWYTSVLNKKKHGNQRVSSSLRFGGNIFIFILFLYHLLFILFFWQGRVRLSRTGWCALLIFVFIICFCNKKIKK